MLKLIDNSGAMVALLTQLKDFSIESDLSTLDKLISFKVPKSTISRSLLQQESFLLSGTDEYVIKEINTNDQDYYEVYGKLNLDSLRGKAYLTYETDSVDLASVLAEITAGTGWTYQLVDSNTKLRSLKLTNVSVYQIVLECCSIYGMEAWFDTLSKVIRFSAQRGLDRGAYVYSELNLKNREYQSDTYDLVTRLYPYGKDGLTIESVNGGLQYIDNTQFTDKVIERKWLDERYTNAQALYDDAVTILDELSKPRVSFQVDVLNLVGSRSEYSILDFQLGDWVRILDKENQFMDTQRIVRLIEYPLTPEKNKADFSNSQIKYSGGNSKQIADLSQILSSTKAELNIAIDQVTALIVNGEAGNVVMRYDEDNKPYEILIMDTDDINTATKVWRWNMSGLSYAATGYSGPYTTAITMDGQIVANFISTGTLSADRIAAHSLTADKLAAGTISAESGVIADLAVTNAKILSLDAAKITTGYIAADRIQAGSIDTAKLAAGAITSDKIAAGAVTAEKIIAGAIAAGSAIIADGAITSAKIGDAQITTAKIAAGAITNALIDTGAIGTAQIADGSITDAKIVTLTASKITAGTIDAANINVINLNADNLTVGSINGQRISDGAISEAKLASGAVSSDKIAVGAVSADHITAGAITGDKIVASAITADKIAAATITANKLVTGTITAASGIIADAAITTAKIADAQITSAKIVSIDAAKITTGTLDAARIAAGSLTASKLAAGTITAASGVIADAAITNAKIADATIQSAKIASLDAGKITTGTLQSATGNSWISLVNGQFSFGNGALAWNGSSLSAKGVFEAISGTYTAKLDAGSVKLINSGVDLGYFSIQATSPTGPWITAANGGYTINLAKLVGSSLYTAYQVNWGSTSGTSATHKFWGAMTLNGYALTCGAITSGAIAADGVVSCWRVEPHLDNNDRCGTTTKRWQAVHALEGYFNKLTIGSNTCWAAGAMSLTTASWTTVSFGKTFPSAPRVFGQYTHNFTGDIGMLKIRSITTTNFQATIGGSGFSGISANWFAILV